MVAWHRFYKNFVATFKKLIPKYVKKSRYIVKN